MGNPPEFKVSTEIRASPPLVWSVLVDVERWPEWSASFSQVMLLTPGLLRVESRVRIRQPKLPPTVWRVTEARPSREFTWVADGPGYWVTARHSIAAIELGTRVTLSIHYDGLVGFLFAHCTRRLNETYLAMEANGLKRRSEELGQSR